jgi:glycosyltransferase involved in cell wall biosynthesis
VLIPTARHLNFGDVPVAVMVRNMEPLVIPFATSSIMDAVRNLGRRHVARRACDAAERVFAVSEYVRDFLTTRWHMSPSRIGLVYHGVDAPLATSKLEAPPSVASIGAQPFLFTAGSLRPARGLEDVIIAFSQLASPRRHRLVIAGEVTGSRAYLAKVRRLAGRSGIADEIIWAGQLSPGQMAWCYSRCAAFVMSSRVEACPNTALEAMAHGVTIVSTRNAPMPEFFGDAALYYPAGDASVLASRLAEALSQPDDRREAVAALARKRVSEFTWQRTAESTVQELRACIEHRVGDSVDTVSARADARRPASHPQSLS